MLKKSRNGKLTLRAKDGLFITKEPILFRPEDFSKYLIDVQFFGHTVEGEAGHPDPEGRVGELVRYELSEPVQDVDEKGDLLTITLTAIEARSRMIPDSESHRLKTPKESFQRRWDIYSLTKGLTGVTISYLPIEINLPSNEFLRQDWLPGPQKFTHDNAVNIIDVLSKPTIVGGDFTDKYFYFITSPTLTNVVEVRAEEFGTRSSGINLDARRINITDIYEKKHTVITNNKKLRNVWIVRGQDGSHSLPLEIAQHHSDIEHGKIAPIWIISFSYLAGDYVQSGFVMYKAKIPHTSDAGNAPGVSAVHWENLSTKSSHTPLTNDVDLWKSMLSGDDPTSDGFYEGMFVDINIVQPNYDRVDDNNEFESLSVKDYDHVVNDPADTAQLPALEIHNGKRVLVGTSPVGIFAGQANKIAQYFDNNFDPAVWKFSLAPTTDDIIWNRKLGEGYKWSGAAWVKFWDLTADYATASPFHPVKSISLAANHLGVANTAIKFVFDWDDSVAGKAQNRASRWYGFSFRLPAAPRLKGTRTVGDLWKVPVLDFENLSRNVSDNFVANWNNGPKTMDLGNLRGMAGRINIDVRNNADQKINGLFDLITRWWFRDLQDHRVFVDVKIRVSGDWIFFKFDAGPQARMQLHDDRTDELFKLLGFTFPHNFFIKERDLGGIRFDWNHVKEFGMQGMMSYDGNTFYKGVNENYLERTEAQLKQAFSNLLSLITLTTVNAGKYIIDHTDLYISELYFLKDAYVTTASAVNTDARIGFSNTNRFFDFQTLLGIASGELARSQHYPQFTPIDAYLDPRMRLGESFTATGPKWQGSPRTLTCAEYTIHEGENGARMEVLGYEKF